MICGKISIPMKRLAHFAVIIIALLASCSPKTSKQEVKVYSKNQSSKNEAIKAKPADANIILARREVPVLCYHQIRNTLPTDSKRAHDDIISAEKFKEHIKMLADSGYHTILPDQLYDYLV